MSSELIAASLSEPDESISTVLGHISIGFAWMSSNHVRLLLGVQSVLFHSRTHHHAQLYSYSYRRNTDVNILGGSAHNVKENAEA